MIDIIIIFLVGYGIASYRDATKEYEKKWNKGNYDSYFSHSNNWHLETTAIWVIIFLAFAIVTGNYKILYNSIAFLTLDFFYYVWKWFINRGETFLPEHLNWFKEDWDSKLNPFRWFEGDFTRTKFIIIWLSTLIISFALQFFT